MKKNIIYISALISMFAFVSVSCDDYLDVLPDNRAELDTQEKVRELLVWAYPQSTFCYVTELYSDNTDDNGGSWTPYNLLQEQAATWQDITEPDNDSPEALWNDCYKAIAAANEALKAIEEMGNKPEMNPHKGEALLCRAYGHFVLANVFCKAYNQETASTDLGIPFSSEPETTVAPKYERGNLETLYSLINKDIEEGLPLINDALYLVPKYHFNKKAAYAFAARFNLFYMQKDLSNLDKVIKYAEVVLTSNPATMLRDWQSAGKLSNNGNIRGNEFINSQNKATLLVQSCYSLWGRVHGPYGLGQKYTHYNFIAEKETCKAKGPWGTYSSLYYTIPSYSGLPKVIMRKICEYFEYTDVINGIGMCHIMYPAFTTDETLLCRAEAYALKRDYESAANDLNIWMHAFTKSTLTLTPELMEKTYGEPIYNANNVLTAGLEYYTPSAPTARKRLNPLGFTVESGMQEAFIHGILHMRRILTLHEGLRWFDVKRYGIEIYRRNVYDTQNVVVYDEMKVDDPRRAIQLPQNVITAGMEANPRITKN